MKSVFIFVLSMIIVAVVASALIRAQTPRPTLPILTGDDLGFRVEGRDGKGRPTGVLVGRIGGEWVELGASVQVVPAH